MSRWLPFAAGALVVVATSGCTLLSSPYDRDYALYGGNWERTNMTDGRVGSAFEDVGRRATGEPTITPEPPAPAPALPEGPLLIPLDENAPPAPPADEAP